jgi:hypothetical protein
MIRYFTPYLKSKKLKKTDDSIGVLHLLEFEDISIELTRYDVLESTYLITLRWSNKDIRIRTIEEKVFYTPLSYEDSLSLYYFRK